MKKLANIFSDLSDRSYHRSTIHISIFGDNLLDLVKEEVKLFYIYKFSCHFLKKNKYSIWFITKLLIKYWLSNSVFVKCIIKQK